MNLELRYLSIALCLFAQSSYGQNSLPNGTGSIESTPLKTYANSVRYATADVQWTPTSVTVIEQAEIEATFRRTLEDLDGYVPGLVIDATSGLPQSAAIGMRGIDSNQSSLGFEPAVAVTIDGIYIGTHAAQNQHLFDFETIEVARGPQGTFTAAPAEGGAIHLTRTKPTGEFGLKTRISAGEFNGNNLDAVLNFAITQELAGKFTIAHQKRDGADLKNLVSDRREYGLDSTSYSLAFLWKSNNDWTAHYTFDLGRDDSDTPGLINLSQRDALVCLPDPTNAPNTLANCASNQEGRQPESGSRQRFLQNFSNTREYETDAHTLRIEGEVGDHQFTSVTGFRNTKETTNLDLDATFIDKHSSNVASDYHQFSTDLRVHGQYSENLSYIVGGYYFRSEYDTNENNFFVLDTLGVAGLVLPQLVPNQVRSFATNQESTTLSAFGHVNYQWDEQWSFDFGIRAATYEKDFDHTVIGVQRVPFVAGSTVLPPVVNAQIDGDKEFNELAGNLGFVYKVDNSAMIYGRYSVDHTPGGFNDRALSAESAGNYDTSTTQGIELGMKSHWLEERLRLNLAFYNNYQDDKVERFANRLANGQIEFTFDNVGEIEVRGFDLEVEYAATDRLYFRGSWGHMNSDYVRYELPDLTSPGDVIDLDREPERAPSDSLYLNGQYSVPYRSGTVSIFAGYQYFADYRSNPDLDIGNVRSFSTWDASIEYAWQDYKVRLFSQNINDKRFLVNAAQTFDAQFVSLPATATSTQTIATFADVNRPRYTGVEFVWQPNFSRD